MTRLLGIMNKQSVRFYKVGRKNRPFAIVNKRLYYIPEERFLADTEGEREICLYDLEGTQPYGYVEYLNPDLTKAYLDHAKDSGGKVSDIGGLSALSGEKLIGLAVLVIVLYAIIGGMV